MIRKILTSSLIALVGIGGFFVNIGEQETTGDITITGIEVYADATADALNAGIENPTDFNAVGAPETLPDTTDAAKKWNDMIDYLNMALGALTFVVSPAVILASWLMSPDWTSGDLFGLREVMHTLWITVSNILYFVYAVLLIIIALATMFNQEKFGYKVMLPKLALGIILVPFTWWFVQWTISLAAVVTTSVVSIPTDTISKVMDDAGSSDASWYNRPIIPEEIIVSDTTTQESFTQSTKCLSDGATEDGGSFCISPKKFFTNYGGMWSPLVVYAYGVFKFDKLEHLDGTLDVIQAAIQLVHKGIIGVLMFLVFGILVIALIFMLMMRAIKLWFYAIFSPLFTLHFVVGQDMLGEKMKDFSLKEFIGLAFVPAVVGVTLSFGLVIITAIYSPITQTGGNTTPDGKHELILFGNPSNKITSEIVDGKDGKKISQTTVMIGDVKWIFKGSATNGANNTNGQIFGALDSAGNTLGTIIVDIIALIFIWAAFMAAKGVSKAVDAAIKPFEDMGNSIGKLGMSLPKYTPLPIPGGSLRGAEKATESIQGMLHANAERKYEDSGTGRFLSSLNPKISLDADDVAKISRVNSMNDPRDFMKEASTALREVKNKGKGEAIMYNPQLQKTVDKLTEIGKDKAFDAHTMATSMGIDHLAAQRIGEIAKGSLNEEAKRKMIAALATGASYTSIDGSSGSIRNAESYLKSSGGGGSNPSPSGTGGNNNGGFSAKPAADNADNLILDVGGVAITVSKDGRGVDPTELEKLKTKIGVWTKAEFENNLTQGGISTESARRNIVDAVSNVKEGSKKFFKEESPN